MSRKTQEIHIATSAIVEALTALPSGLWFFFQNVRLQGSYADKPKDSLMSEARKSGITRIGERDVEGVPVDVLVQVESPSASWRIDEATGKRLRGVNYPAVVFRGTLMPQALAAAKAWDTVSIFGKVETSYNKETKTMSQRYTALYLTDGSETVSAQLASDTSFDIRVTEDASDTAAQF
jgi:hypothetical protein